MEHMEAVMAQLELLGYGGSEVRMLQDEEDVLVARALSPAGQAVIKVYLAPGFRREIGNYRLLEQLGIPALRVLGSTDMALLLEDVDVSPSLRLGCREDLDSPEVGTLIARWYRCLHDRGREYLAAHPEAELYRETDALTAEHLRVIMERTGTSELAVWDTLDRVLPEIRRAAEGLTPTLNYNDFYYTNLIVARDLSSAMMYDYDLLGRGYAWADVRNVCSSLGPDARAAFLREYGPTDTMEKLVDDVVCPLCTLWSACELETFPGWARSSLDCLREGLQGNVNKLLGGISC